jgi:hypothetical protein
MSGTGGAPDDDRAIALATGSRAKLSQHATRGIRLPDGEYRIERDCNNAILEATGSAPHHHGEAPHPSLATVATLAATGLTIDDLCRLCDASVADGPMLGECRIVQHRPLVFDLLYSVKRRVLSIERKHSRRLGEMDLLRFVAELQEPDATIAAAVTYTWILPKGVRP